VTEQVSRHKLPHWLGSAAFAAALVIAAVVFRSELVAWFSGERAASAPVAGAADSHGDIDHYTCPMHPSVKQAGPGKCPLCGMTLVPVTKAQQAEGVVVIDQARRQLIGVRTDSVKEGPLRRSLRAVGRVTVDESSLTDVTLKVPGFISKLFVSQTGQRVQAGQPLFELFSPELFGAQQDFLLASQAGATGPGAPGTPAGRVELLARAGRQRLQLLGLTDAQIDALEKSGTPSQNLTFPSPASGFVLEKDVVQGARVEAGMRLYRIAKLDRVWVEADVYEADLPYVRVGQSASVSLDYLPGRAYEAKVSYVYPLLDPAARTGRVRVELANKKFELRPGMYASVTLATDAEPRLQVPTTAVVYTGPRRLVFVELGEGRFRPQEVRIGTEADGMYEVLEGLAPGDRVATSGVFLIAAEARISTAAKYWEKQPEDAGVAPAPSSLPSSSASTASPFAAKPIRTTAVPTPPRSASSAAKQPSATVFTCPMHAEVQSATPGNCPICGMKLVPKVDGASP
jgi:Cu(I)/Ag(I) efflux system membrane fusion protein